MSKEDSLSDDQKRVSALHNYGILDTLPESEYEDITLLASQICGAPIALISFVDQKRQWFKSNRGLDLQETARSASFCAHNLEGSTNPMIVGDARLDPRFAENPLVTGEPHIVFYAGVPLVNGHGLSLGSLCVIDQKTRELSAGQVSALQALARQVMKLLDARIANSLLRESEQVSKEQAYQQTQLRITLNESEKTLLSLFEQSPVGIALIDQHELTFQMANPFYASLIGRPTEQIIGKPLLDALPELAGQGFDDLLRDVIATGKPYIANHVPVDLVRNGLAEKIYVNLTYQPRRDPTLGLVTGILVVATDITLQVRTQQELATEKQRLSNILHELPMGVLIANPQGDLTYGNPSVEQIFRHPFRESKDMEAYKNWQFFDPQTNEPFLLQSMPLVRTLTTGETVVGTEIKLLRGDGTWGYASVSSVPVYNTLGQIELAVAAFVDITEKKQSEEALRKNEELLRTILESILDGIYIGDLAGITLVNQAALDQLGFKSRQEFNRNIGILASEIQTRDCDTGEYISIEQQAFARALKGEHVVQDVLVRHRLTGEEMVVRCAASPVVLEGNIIAAVAINSDVTKYRQTQQALRQSEERYRRLSMDLEKIVQQRTHELTRANHNLERSNRNLQEFAYVASHDLQEPLRKIQAFSSRLIAELGDRLTDKTRDNIDRINKAGLRMSVLIADLLSYSRVSTRQQTFGLVSLDAILADVVSNLDLTITQTRAQVSIGELPVVQGDERQLSQLFENLLSNAIKFAKNGETPSIYVTSAVRQRDEIPLTFESASDALMFHEISIADQGIGFDTKYLDRIFQVFQRLHGRSEYEGTGVGLAICKRVVENHGGGITAKSSQESGATFYVYLPL